jgi:hypothetical protein
MSGSPSRGILISYDKGLAPILSKHWRRSRRFRSFTVRNVARIPLFNDDASGVMAVALAEVCPEWRQRRDAPQCAPLTDLCKGSSVGFQHSGAAFAEPHAWHVDVVQSRMVSAMKTDVVVT